MEARSQLRHRPTENVLQINFSTGGCPEPLCGLGLAALRFTLWNSRQPAQQRTAVAPERAPVHAAGDFVDSRARL